MNTEPINWGILGPGHIAQKFAVGLQAVGGARLLAVGSRTQEKADAFADQFAIPRRYAGYEALVADPDIDVVYIATPHPGHREAALLCLEHGKAVLCEKPFTVNAKEAEEVIAVARMKSVFLMEAMWSRFFPAMSHLRQLLADGAIGEVRMVQADFGFRADIHPESRLFSPNLAGGGLLDVGIYPISLASMIFGQPSQVAGLAQIGATGVDEQAAIVLSYPGGQLASLTCGIRIETPHDADILGTDGRIKVHAPWWKPSKLTLIRGEKATDISMPYESNGMNYEAQEVNDCLRQGKTESDLMPLNETLAIMKTLDTLRGLWGLKYPMESCPSL